MEKDEMILIVSENEPNEKRGTQMTDTQTVDGKTSLDLLRSIDGKLDILLEK